MKSKKGFEMSFAWMFAIIVGGVILFLAVYFISVIIPSETNRQDTLSGKEIGILLSPVENSLSSSRSSRIFVNGDTRVYNFCKGPINDFGRQEIRLATKSGIGAEWPEPGVPHRFNNKYLFSEEIIEGSEFYIYSKSLNLPYKAADLLIMWSNLEDYCFKDAPREIKETIDGMGFDNLHTGQCPSKAIEICFIDSRCDIDVDLSSKSVTKNRQTVYFESSFSGRLEEEGLIYAAIFSDPEIYECQLKRVMARSAALSEILVDKSERLSTENCGSLSLVSDLEEFAGLARNMETSRDIRLIKSAAEELKEKNDGLNCKLF